MHRLLVGLVLALAPLAVVVHPAGALSATTTTLVAPSGYAGDPVTLQVRVQEAGGAAVAGAPVVVERRVDQEWGVIATVVTGPDGVAEVVANISRLPGRNVFRASYAGDETRAPSASPEVTATLLRRDTTLTLDGPSRIVDESSVTLVARWRTTTGDDVAGQPVRLDRLVDGRWVHKRTVRTGTQGRARFPLAPRIDSTWRVRAPALPWAKGAVSARHHLDNVPRMAPVSLPAGAPPPRITLPAQKRAVGSGPNPVVTRIPDGVWRHMVGRSWHRGCPVGRAGLRLVRVNYWGFDGYRHRGELVVAAGAAGQVARAFSALHRKQLPLRSMYRVDRFGWSSRLNGADDYASMAADNTSAFNCRDVVGRPGRVSPHSYGRSVDLNPWENPYRSSSGWVPNSWWVSRSHPQVAWRSRSHAVVSTMAEHGFAWTYGVDDAHHFDARTGSGRILLRGTCDAAVCE